MCDRLISLLNGQKERAFSFPFFLLSPQYLVLCPDLRGTQQVFVIPNRDNILGLSPSLVCCQDQCFCPSKIFESLKKGYSNRTQCKNDELGFNLSFYAFFFPKGRIR